VSIEARSALISTASVEIKTLTLNGKQITLAVFRQFPYGRLLAEDGSLNGEPWGWINHHPDRSCRGWEHKHVIWQQRGRLYRDAIAPLEEFEEGYAYHGLFVRLPQLYIAT